MQRGKWVCHHCQRVLTENCLKIGYALDNGYIEVEHTLQLHQLSGSIFFGGVYIGRTLSFPSSEPGSCEA